MYLNHLLCDKDCKTEDDYSNYAEKSFRNKEKAYIYIYILKEIEVNGKLVFLQIITSISKSHSIVWK